MAASPRSVPLADALALWEASPSRTPFTHPAFVQASGEAFGLAPVALLSASGEAGIIGLERRRGPIRALALAPTAPEAPPLVASGAEDALDSLIAQIGARYPQASVALGAECADARPWAQAGWTVATRYTHRLAVDADCAERWSKTTRWEARKNAPDYTVEWGDAHIQSAAEMEVASYERKDLSLGIPVSALVRLARGLSEAGLVRAAAARNVASGDVEAAVVFAHARGTAWYWMAGSVPGPAMTVLLAQAVPHLASGGIDTLDWAGANVAGVAEFKRKRADALVPTLTARRIGPRWLRVLDALR